MNAIIITLIHSIVFLGAGLFIATNLVKRKLIPEQYTLISTYAVSCLIGYGLFYFYAYSPGLGTYGTGAFYLFGFISLLTLAYESGKNASLRRLLKLSVLPPLALILFTCGFYTAVTFTCQGRNIPSSEPPVIYHACILYNAPGDNVLPQFFGDKILQNRDGEPSGDWKLADRPPLQIGSVISILDILPSDAAKIGAYQVFSTFLQLAWIAGLWALLKSMKLKKDKISFVLLGSIFTGFFYYNSIYVWPKLLAAAFAVSAISLILYGRGNKTKDTEEYLLWLSVAVFLTLSFLSHGSTLFTLIPLGIYLLATKRLPSAKVLFLAGCVAILLYSPWMLYKGRTTTSDRLVKWHFAGVIAVDSRSTLTTIIDAYKSTTPTAWAKGRINNVRALFKRDIATKANIHVAKDPTQRALINRLRIQEFFATIPALGLFNLGWISLFYARKKDKVLFKKIKPLIILAISSLAIWCLMLFTSGTTVIHHNSYTTMMLIFTFLLLALGTLKAKLRYAIIAAQIFLFFTVWVFHLYYENQASLFVGVSISLMGLIGVIILTYGIPAGLLPNRNKP